MRGNIIADITSLLGGGYLRLPMSLTIVMVTLRALCQEREEAGPSRYGHRRQDTKKREATLLTSITSLRGRLPTLPLSQYHRRGEA